MELNLMTIKREPIIYSDGTKISVNQNVDYELVSYTLEKGWYYYDEAWFDLTGPFETKEEAITEQQRYFNFINSEPKVA